MPTDGGRKSSSGEVIASRYSSSSADWTGGGRALGAGRRPPRWFVPTRRGSGLPSGRPERVSTSRPRTNACACPKRRSTSGSTYPSSPYRLAQPKSPAGETPEACTTKRRPALLSSILPASPIHAATSDTVLSEALVPRMALRYLPTRRASVDMPLVAARARARAAAPPAEATAAESAAAAAVLGAAVVKWGVALVSAKDVLRPGAWTVDAATAGVDVGVPAGGAVGVAVWGVFDSSIGMVVVAAVGDVKVVVPVAHAAAIRGVPTASATNGAMATVATAGVTAFEATGGATTDATTGGVTAAAVTCGVTTFVEACGVTTTAATGGVKTAVVTGGVKTAAATGGVTTAVATGCATTAATTAAVTAAVAAAGVTSAGEVSGVTTAAVTADVAAMVIGEDVGTPTVRSATIVDDKIQASSTVTTRRAERERTSTTVLVFTLDSGVVVEGSISCLVGGTSGR